MHIMSRRKISILLFLASWKLVGIGLNIGMDGQESFWIWAQLMKDDLTL